MANDFQVVISAVDKSTAVINKINQSFGSITKPIVQVQSAVSRLGKEMGLDRMGKSLVQVGKAARDVGGQVASIVAPMAAVVGVGSVAAVAALATEWGKLGAEIGRTSATLGVSANELQALRGAAQASGVSAESLTGGLKSLGDTMEDALNGRNQGALAMMNRLGVTMKRTADGAMDTTSAFMDLADVINRPNMTPQVQGLVARTFGLEASLPLLRQGSAGIAELERQVKATGAVMSGPALAAATQWQKSMGFLDLSVQGLRNSIGAELLPIFNPLVDQLRGWISANRDLVATKAGEFATGVAAAIKQIDWQAVVQGAKGFAASVESVVDWLGGWEHAVIAVVAVMNASLIVSVVKLGGLLLELGLGTIPVVVKALGLLTVATEASVIPALVGGAMKLGLVTESLAGLAAGVPIVGTALTALSGGFVAVGAAIEATPVGWIATAVVAAVGLIGFAGYELVKHWQDIKDWWHRLWGGMGDDAAAGAGKIKGAASAVKGDAEGHWRRDSRGGRTFVPAVPAPLVAPAATANAVRVETATPAVPAAPAAAGPLGLRQNNPGNLRSWGQTPIANGYAQFPTAFDGLSAMAGNLRAYGNHGFNTIDSIVDRWAPASDHNNTAAYKADVAKQTGFDPKAALDLNNPAIVQALMPAIVKHENGQNPYDAGLIAQAVSARFAQPVGVPAQRSVATSAGVAVPPLPQLDALAKQMGITVATPQAGAAPAVPTPYSVQTAAKTASTGESDAGAPGGGPMGTIVVDISFADAPKGMTSKVRTTGPVVANVKIGHAMPESGVA